MKPTKCVLIKKAEIDKALTTPATKGKKSLEPFKSFAEANNLPMNIVEDMEVSDNNAEVHKGEGDLWLCLEGKVKFIYGGELVDPWPRKKSDGSFDESEMRAKEIKNGTETMLEPGDWLWIPAGEPHQHVCEGVGRLMIIKIPSK
jgi:mannose-6-phosphate isomerase-like protein (cupin superfamily)